MLTKKRTIVDSLNGHDTPLPSSILLPYGGQKHMFPKYCHIFHFWPKFCINSSSQSPHEVKQILKRDISKMFTYMDFHSNRVASNWQWSLVWWVINPPPESKCDYQPRILLPTTHMIIIRPLPCLSKIMNVFLSLSALRTLWLFLPPYFYLHFSVTLDIQCLRAISLRRSCVYGRPSWLMFVHLM